MMDTLVKLSSLEMGSGSEIPRALRLYPSFGNTDASGIEIFWAPFDHVNIEAKLVVIGVTPGPTQALLSYKTARNASDRGRAIGEDLAKVKTESSFRGEVIEHNLKSLLEHSGAAERAGIEDIDNLWTTESEKVHFTSTIRYPTYIGGKMYNNQIDSLRHPELRKYVEDYLASELASVPKNAEIVVLGEKGPRIVRHAAGLAKVDPKRIVELPHPSPNANGAVRTFLSKTKTRSQRRCRCMLCDRTRIPTGWDLSNRFQSHAQTHARIREVR